MRGAEDEQLIKESLADFEILGFLPEQDEIVSSDRDGRRPFDDIRQGPEELFEIADKLKAMRSR